MDPRRRGRLTVRRLHPERPGLFTPENAWKAVIVYSAFLFVSYSFSSAQWRCPKELECDKGTMGYFWDAPGSGGGSGSSQGGKGGRGGGHLMERDVGLGLLASDSCSKLCQDVPDCALWMYTKTTTTGLCRLWAAEQSPCRPHSWWPLFPLATVRYAKHGRLARNSLVGGGCRQEDEEGALEGAKLERTLIPLQGDIGDIDPSGLETRECPHLECAVAERGFLFDHKAKGHLRSIKLSIKKRRGYNCYMHCRETPDCSIWMVDEKDPDGECKMWSKDQSPCEPTDPYDASTAHYVASIPGREFLMGGNCHKLPPRPHKAQKT